MLCARNILRQDTSIVRSRNGNTFDEIAETALEEESAIFSKNEHYRQGPNTGKLARHNCGKTGHLATKCYLKDKRDVRVSKLGMEPGEGVIKPRGLRKNDVKCYNCGESGYIARGCRKPRNPRKFNQVGSTKTEDKSSERSNFSIGSVNTIGNGNRSSAEGVRLQNEVSNGRELLLLDKGADMFT